MNLQPFIDKIQSAEMKKYINKDLCEFILILESGENINFDFYYEVEYDHNWYDDPQIKVIYYYETLYYQDDNSDGEAVILDGSEFEDAFLHELLRRHPLTF